MRWLRLRRDCDSTAARLPSVEWEFRKSRSTVARRSRSRDAGVTIALVAFHTGDQPTDYANRCIRRLRQSAMRLEINIVIFSILSNSYSAETLAYFLLTYLRT